MGLFGNENKAQIKKLGKIASRVFDLDENYSVLTDEQLKNQTQVLKDRLKNGETLDDILPDAFAVCREASWRVLKMKHFFVQVLGGISLHQGRIAEMKTGEGKTLMATLPAYLNALSEKGVHIVTVNEYLAKRDAEWMGKVYRFLGLSVGVIVSGKRDDAKQKEYACDICYCTNNELGFDYLRDNMATSKEARMQRGQAFAIIDEVDSILIDEARTPLIISGQGGKSGDDYVKADKFAKKLKKDEDFEIDEKTKQINLTESGVEKAERFYSLKNLSDIENLELNHYINNAVKANNIMFLNENYIVKDGEVVIVDEFTGRLMDGRRFNDGLHQSIEAKEGVEIKDENKTLATITFQNYFRLYNKLSGMTGTAKTEEGEFRSIYNLDVVIIPPNLENKRIDEPDIIYTTEKGKIKAIAEEIKRQNKDGRPILVGTVTIEKSEELSKALKHEGIKHIVLNAKNHEQESNIVAQAGRKNAVTIATNMAGRGTDILLGGNPEFLAKKKMEQENFTPEEISYATAFNNVDDKDLNKARERFNELFKQFKVETDKEKEEVKNLGGLHIVGSERHESRRIDNQLRGRAGRQGDPGSSVFILSLEDDLIRRFGGDRMKSLATMFRINEETPIQLKMLSKQITNAQKRIEVQNFSIRKTVLRFDDVMNAQRTIIYDERNKILDGLDVHDQIVKMFPGVVSKIVLSHIDDDKPYYDWDLQELNNALEKGLLEKDSNTITEEFVEDCESGDVIDKVLEIVERKYQDKIDLTKQHNADFSRVEKAVMLRVVDSLWMNHIDDMQIMKNEIFARGFGNQDPVLAYKKESFALFDEMIEKIRELVSLNLLNVRIEFRTEDQKPIEKPSFTPTNRREDLFAKKKEEKPFVQKTVVNDADEQKRNQLCKCGSGKKFKNCCGK